MDGLLVVDQVVLVSKVMLMEPKSLVELVVAEKVKNLIQITLV
jgi:hypothetical protein